MRMPFPRSDRTRLNSVQTGLATCALAILLTGCASKNPLMDDTPVVTNTSPATASPAAAPARATAEAPVESGVQTTKPTGLRKFFGIFSPYRIDVQQGNFVTREMVDQLKEGMKRPEGVTREQVRFALGTPLLTDPFHADRWDYVFRLQKKNGEVISSHVTTVFNNNRLERIDGGELPTEQEYLSYISGSTPGASRPSK